jgi:hypothetical protein
MSDKPIQEIDHLLTYVRDLGAAASLFRRMGFTLSPISEIESMGIANHLVLMRPAEGGFANYIELMTARDRAALPPPMARALSGGEGGKSIVLVAKDAAAAQAAMVRHGFPAPLPLHVKREWALGPAESVFPEFDVILPFETPLTFNCCRYYNVELYLRPDWLEHRNGAQRLRTVFAVAHEPEPLARSFGALFEGRVVASDGAFRATPGRIGLELMSPAVARTRFGVEAEVPASGAGYIGYAIEVASLDRLQACLREGGVAHRREGGAISVDPATGLGNLILFEEAAGT